MEIDVNMDESPRLKQATLAEFTCRICFEPESQKNFLITPCKCSGSMKYIHEECLKIWLLSQDKDLSISECDVCKTKFIMKIKLCTKCTCKNYWNECLAMFIFPILLVLMTSILLVILIFLIQGIQDNKSSAGEQTYLVLLVVACTIIIVIIFIIFVKSIKRGCFSAEMVSWNIESIAHQEIVDETIEPSHPSQMVDDSQFMFMPKFSILNGRKVVRPEILTPRLLPILRSGEIIGYRPKNVISKSLNVSQALNFSLTINQTMLSSTSEQKVMPIV